MISLVKAIIGYCCAIVGKRGELRYGDILPAPKLSSSCRVLKYLSSRVLLKMSLRGEHLCSTWQSQQNETISRDAHVGTLSRLSMTINVIVFSLFLLFPSLSYSAVYFLPDAQWDGPSNVSIDSSQCELAGYTYYASGTCPAYHNQETCVFMDKYLKCDGTGWCMDNGYTLSSCPNPKVLTTQCPNGYSLYKSCVCPSTYKYACTGTGYSGGSGTVCDGKYTSCACGTNYVWSGSACVCDSAFNYTCSGTGYNSGSGASCGGKYKSCNCSTYYSWNGSACAHVHSYVCPSGYSTSNSGMVEPTSTAKVCQLSGCSSTSGTCYKETHVHSYACASGYSTSCSNGYSASSAKTCSHSKCSATSGTCYKCCADTYKYTCSGTGYSSGSGTACSGKYTSCNCSAQYKWSGSACSYCGDSYKYACSVSGNITGGSGTACGSRYTACTCKSPFTWSSGSCVCPSTYKYACTGTGYSSGSGTACNGKYTSCNCANGYHWTGSACEPHNYSCPSGYSSSCSYGYWGTSSKKCSCGATSGTCYDCKSYCEAYPCGSGCYTDLSCSYGCASYNSCGGCSSCASDPCAGVSCPSAVSCSYGCAGYSSATSCCSSVCTSCKSKCEANPCASGCYTNKSCTYGCASTNSCGGCESCKSDPCTSVTCPSAVSCSYGCASYSTATSCCSSVCTSCKSKCEADPCASGCYTDLTCARGCAYTNSCGGCAKCKVKPETCPTPSGCSSCTNCSSCSGVIDYCIPTDEYGESYAAVYFCCN